jgi:enolase
MIAPIGARSFSHAMQIGTEIYHALKAVITDKYGKAATGLGDEGGFAPPLKTPDEALSLLEQATISAGYRAHFQGPLDVGDVAFGVDPASSEFYDKHVQMYDLAFKFTRQERAEAADKMRLTGAELGQLYRDILQRHPIVLLEDPFAEDDFESWARFTQLHSENLEIVGDDLLATNPERIRIGIEKKLCNSLLLKINQIGTISEAINSAKLATRNGWSIFVSHRSGETVDDFIADCE